MPVDGFDLDDLFVESENRFNALLMFQNRCELLLDVHTIAARLQLINW